MPDKQLKNKMIFLLLFVRTKILQLLIYIRSLFINTTSLIIVKENKPKNELLRYYLIRMLQYIITFFKKMRDSLDLDVDKIEITKSDKDDKNKYILEGSKTNITTLIKYIESDNKNIQNINKGVFFKFNIKSPDKDPICLKKYILNYRDENMNFNNTLENIIIFNNIDIDSNNSNVDIIVFKDQKLNKYLLPYKDVSKKHINHFYQL